MDRVRPRQVAANGLSEAQGVVFIRQASPQNDEFVAAKPRRAFFARPRGSWAGS
jgi:hypothetical protein